MNIIGGKGAILNIKLQSLYFPTDRINVYIKTIFISVILFYVSGRQEYYIGIFLPPRYHILLKLHLVSDRIVISIAIDCNTTLPLLHRYLSEAMSIL